MKDEIVQEIVREGRLFEVGGCVRDSLMGRACDLKDRDYLVTGIPLERLEQILRRHGRVDLVGRSFGVLKFTPFSRARDGQEAVTYDISLPRSEKSTGTAHRDFAVDCDPTLPVEVDLGRRDFSINALARNLSSLEIIDPFGGRADIDRGLIRMVSDQSFADDPLRMLRAIQFAARFEFTIEPRTLEAIREKASLVATVSAERIAEELNKMFVRARRPSIGLDLMRKTGLLAHLLPELETAIGCDQPGGYHAYDVFEHTLRIVDACPPRLRLRLAALFHDITKPEHRRLTETGATFYGHERTGAETARAVLRRLRYPNDLVREVGLLVDRHMFTTEVGPKGLRRFIRRVGKELIADLMELRRADIVAQGMGGTVDDVDAFEKAIGEEIERKPPFGRSDLALNGRDLQEILELSPSPFIGELLDYLLEKVLDIPEDNTYEVLARYAREYAEMKKKSIN